MKYSSFYTKTKRDVAKQDSINAYLLDKAGYVSQTAAGVYALLPMATRVFHKIEQIVREEMNAVGGNEVIFSAIQPQDIWEKSGRWEDPNFRQIVYFDQDAKVTFGATHEEPMAKAVKESVQSYRDLPVLLYQFQTKFRKELRAKSGLLRGREFRMKDLYSFHADEKAHNEFYEKAAQAYLRVFARVGLEVYRVKASGGVFSEEFSDEFQVICSTGEDEILVDHTTKTGFNKEVEDQLDADDKNKMERVKSIEVGNIFHLGSKYPDAFNLNYLDREGKTQKIIMGSYGIGITRLIGTLAEIYNDEHGLKWPVSVAPFQIYLIDLTDSGEGEKLYAELTAAGYDVLFDDRDLPAGNKMIDADLLGVPVRLVYSKKTAEQNEVEMKVRVSGEIKQIGRDLIKSEISKIFS